MTTHHHGADGHHASDGHHGSDGRHGTGPHGADPHTDIDWDAMAVQLERGAEIQTDYLEDALAWTRGLLLEGGCGGDTVRRVLDVGAGPGVTTAMLARTFPRAVTVAVDGEPALLARARARAQEQGLGDRVLTEAADLSEGLEVLGEGTADLIWTGHVVHHLGDQQAALDGMARALRPGGLLAVVEGGLGLRFLPRDIGLGRPGLQARLEAAQQDWFTAMREALPGHVATVEDWPAMLQAAGLEHAGTRTFLTELRAPLEQRVREHLVDHVARMREILAERLDEKDVATLDVLLAPDDPRSLLTRPDTHYLQATTLHTARHP